VNLPGADELFRPTKPMPPAPAPPPVAAESPSESPDPVLAEPTGGSAPVEPARPRGGRSGSGRVRHEEKITVYVSTDELLALEQARLRLRAEHDLAADRGRIVRAAVSMALEELAHKGADSDLLRRLTGS